MALLPYGSHHKTKEIAILDTGYTTDDSTKKTKVCEVQKRFAGTCVQQPAWRDDLHAVLEGYRVASQLRVIITLEECDESSKRDQARTTPYQIPPCFDIHT